MQTKQVIHTVSCHAEGEVGDVIVGGVPVPPGKTLWEQSRWISKDQTLLVRQLQPTEKGLPIEIYIFTNDNRWIEYEGIQSDIFDHLLAVLPEFGLNVFQSPTGTDFKNLHEL